ncbi:hypothetical protein C8J57DRAFT_1250718, partial [Mycena rebaudengoi]
MATMISPTYAAKILNKDHNLHPSDRTLREGYRMELSVTVKVFWWIQDGDEPLKFIAPVPFFPFFHPKDCLAITQIIGDVQSYTLFLPEFGWMITAAAQKVKPDQTLYMRSSH